MTRRYVTMIDPSDRAELCDDDMGADESCALDMLADKQFLAKVLLQLSPREERVIRLRFGLGGVGEHTLREIGEELGIGVEAVRRVQNKALRRLRWHACRVFPERAKRAGITVLPRPEPPAPVPGPAPQTTRAVNSAGRTVRDKSRKPAFRPPTSLTPVPTLTSGWLLLAVVASYMAALGLNPTVSYQVAAVLGAPLALLLCLGVGMLGAAISLAVLTSRGGWPSEPDPVARRTALRLALLAVLAAIAGLLAPVQDFLIHLVAATPLRFRTPTPEMVQLFSWAILLLSPVYLRGYWLRECSHLNRKSAMFGQRHLKS